VTVALVTLNVMLLPRETNTSLSWTCPHARYPLGEDCLGAHSKCAQLMARRSLLRLPHFMRQ
jgi:hypothetical protein